VTQEPTTRVEEVTDAAAFLAVRVGDQPLVPAEIQARGPRAVVAAALKRLAALKRPPARVLHRQRTHAKACSRSHHSEPDR
jgi:hypothetical protein